MRMRDLQTDPQTKWMAAMRRGDEAAAWAVSDAVLAARDPATRDDPGMAYHLRWVWDGQPFDGRHVLVRCYHGLGDTLQFVRFLPALRARAASVTLEVQPALRGLLADAPGADQVIAFDMASPAPTSGCDIEIMELAHALRLPADAAPAPYLRVAAASAGGVGLCWQAGGWDAARSVPLALLAPALPPVLAVRELVCLQPEPAPGWLRVRNPQGCGAAIADTAALIAGLDLVVTVDTMVAHLAGALGVATWLLLKHDADWRWMRGRADSPWYPSMRLFRQPAPGDWAGVAAEVRAAAAG